METTWKVGSMARDLASHVWKLSEGKRLEGELFATRFVDGFDKLVLREYHIEHVAFHFLVGFEPILFLVSVV